jgi:hypothetical protein
VGVQEEKNGYEGFEPLLGSRQRSGQPRKSYIMRHRSSRRSPEPVCQKLGHPHLREEIVKLYSPELYHTIYRPQSNVVQPALDPD